VVRAVVFHSHLKVCCQHPSVVYASTTAPYVDSARGVQSGEHAILLCAPFCLLNSTLIKRVVTATAVLAALHIFCLRVTDSHWILTATYRLQTHVLQLLLLLGKFLGLFKLLNFFDWWELYA
jgi:hypothetical protein